LLFLGVGVLAQRTKVEAVAGVDSYLRLEVVDESPKRSNRHSIALVAVIV
jgi:hypothetical protein